MLLNMPPILLITMGNEHSDYVKDEAVHVKNPYLDSLKEDILYPLNLGTRTHNLPEMFWDIKFVCVGGSANHMKAFAQFVHQELALPGDATDVQDICAGTDQYSTYKVGTVLSISVKERLDGAIC
ncbi:uridine phosphorylase 2 isoform X2 [Arapaima gigas]